MSSSNTETRLAARPRVRFCWHCGRKLYGNHFAEVKLKDGYVRIVHKACVNERLNEGL